MTNRIYNLKPDPADTRDFLFKAPEAVTLPACVDMRPHMSPVVDQGQLGSCTANAIASGMREYYLLRDGVPDGGLSRLYLYYKERELEGTTDEDAGAYIRDGMKVMQHTGTCPEIDWPYDITKFAVKPPAIADQTAVYKIDTYHRVTTLNEVKAALASGDPVVIGIAVYDSFESAAVAATGIVPMPNKTTEQQLGGHAILIVGYDDAKQWVIVRNSWGAGWGDKGYCYIPYAYIQDATLTFDLWVGSVTTEPAPPVPPTPPSPQPEPWDHLTAKDAVTMFAGLRFKNGEPVIDSPDFWDNLIAKCVTAPQTITADDVRYVELLVRKLGAYVQGA